MGIPERTQTRMLLLLIANSEPEDRRKVCTDFIKSIRHIHPTGSPKRKALDSLLTKSSLDSGRTEQEVVAVLRELIGLKEGESIEDIPDEEMLPWSLEMHDLLHRKLEGVEGEDRITLCLKVLETWGKATGAEPILNMWHRAQEDEATRRRVVPVVMHMVDKARKGEFLGKTHSA